MDDLPPLLRLPVELRLKIYKYLLIGEPREAIVAQDRLVAAPAYYEYEKLNSPDDAPDAASAPPRVLTMRNADSSLARRRTVYKIRADRFRARCIDATYCCTNRPALHVALLRTCRQVYREAVALLYAAYTFDFDAHVEACAPFVADLGPAARCAIRRVRVVKRALPYDKDFDRYEWAAMCACLAASLRLRQLLLGVVAGKPRRGWEGVQAFAPTDFALLARLDEMQWVNDVAAITGLQRLDVRACVEHCPQPESSAMDFFINFSASVEDGFAQYMTGRCWSTALDSLVRLAFFGSFPDVYLERKKEQSGVLWLGSLASHTLSTAPPPRLTPHHQVSDLPDPTPKPDEYTIAIHASATNFFDLLQIRGKYQHQPPFPWISGSEFAGQVIAAPTTGNPKFAVGDRVFGAGQGGYATRVCVREVQLRAVPRGWSYEDAAGLYVTAPTSYAGLVTRAGIKAGDWVLVHAAAGGVGLAAVQIAKAFGATVVATAGTRHKLDVARKFGADHLVDYKDKNWPEVVKKLTPKGRGVDIVYDPVGLIAQSMKCTAWNGRLLVIGFAAGDIEKMATNRILLKNVSVVGLHWGVYAINEPETVPKVWDGIFKLIDEGKFKGSCYSDKKYEGLEQVGPALKALGARDTWGKVVVSVPQQEISKSKI
ncbi:hypothetical protein FH972_021812 [Carpinus fangiana]|uniref:Enoyl reductase (ER) domain-containing protein n=1 Tax=Carpinus fangiana TaxID=176857 RepID=A0A5N6KQS1_9ROSI|nr:hypothetical protein FH972_021812 [Carpinus fangiana]